MAPSFHDRLAGHLDALRSYLLRQGTGLLRFEDVDDLVQGVVERALVAADDFEDRGDEAFVGWLYTLARRHVATRHTHWQTLRRGAGKVLRLTLTGASQTNVTAGVGAAVAPAAEGPGPRTFAEGREQLVLAVQALDTLPERDRQFVRWMSEGMSVSEQAEIAGLEYGAAQRAAHRALDRYRRAFRVLTLSD